MKLPGDPSGLGGDWVQDPNHRNPNGSKWRHPGGDSLEWHKGQPGKPGWRGKDHWHHNDGDDHLPPGAEVPDPKPPNPEPPPPAPGSRDPGLKPEGSEKQMCGETCRDAGKVLGYAAFAGVTYMVVKKCIGVALLPTPAAGLGVGLIVTP